MSIRSLLRTIAILAAFALSLSGPLAGTADAGQCPPGNTGGLC
jgi:hypothetical protein